MKLRKNIRSGCNAVLAQTEEGLNNDTLRTLRDLVIESGIPYRKLKVDIWNAEKAELIKLVLARKAELVAAGYSYNPELS